MPDLTTERMAELRVLTSRDLPSRDTLVALSKAVPGLLDEIERLNYQLTESQTDLDNEREFRDADDQISEMRADAIREEWQIARAERDALAAKVARVEGVGVDTIARAVDENAFDFPDECEADIELARQTAFGVIQLYRAALAGEQ